MQTRALVSNSRLARSFQTTWLPARHVCSQMPTVSPAHGWLADEGGGERMQERDVEVVGVSGGGEGGRVGWRTEMSGALARQD